MNIEIYDPVLCCSTGVCGPQVDPALLRFASSVRWMQDKGWKVDRYNLGQSPMAFARNEVVRAELSRSGESVLPLVLVDGRVVSRGRYPDRQEVEGWAAGVRGVGEVPAPDGPGGSCGCGGPC